jgi:hypothetical protein
MEIAKNVNAWERGMERERGRNLGKVMHTPDNFGKRSAGKRQIPVGNLRGYITGRNPSSPIPRLHAQDAAFISQIGPPIPFPYQYVHAGVRHSASQKCIRAPSITQQT